MKTRPTAPRLPLSWELMITDPDFNRRAWSKEWQILGKGIVTMIQRNIAANTKPGDVELPCDVDSAVMALATIGVMEIMNDMRTGTVPWDVPRFADLGTHVDHNDYALLTRPEMAFDESVDEILIPGSNERVQTFYDVCNAIQSQMDHWMEETILLRKFIATWSPDV